MDTLEKVRPFADSQNPEHTSDLQAREAEVELAHGNKDRAIELFSLADKAKRSAMTIAGVAHASEASGNTEQAIVWYELFLGSAGSSLGWEAQQDCLAAHYSLARIYFSKGDKASAAKQLDWFLEAWKDADPGLPLLKEALSLRKEMDSQP